MKQLCKSIPLLLLTLLATACSDNGDDANGNYPSVITELVDAYSNQQKTLATITNDLDQTYYADNDKTKFTVADTTIRCICVYKKADDNTAHIYSIAPVFSVLPNAKDEFKTLPKSPVTIVSQWTTKRYINLCVKFKTNDSAPHAFSFCIDHEDTDSEGRKVIVIDLLHQRPTGDTSAYSSSPLYISLPIYQYAGLYDLVAFNITTSSGVQTFYAEP